MGRKSLLLVLVAPVAVGIFVACGSVSGESEFADGEGGTGVTPTPTPTTPLVPPVTDTPCTGIKCQQVKCENGGTTSVSGVVMAPNGTLPLYNVVVYVPQEELAPITEGASCDRCGNVSGKPLVSTLSGVDGAFKLDDMPVGKDIPLVVQVGKWRRKVVLPKVDRCVDNKLDDRNYTRLPKSKAEGDLPRIAVTTGRCDQLACLMPKLGLAATEFTAATGAGHVHVYRGSAHPSSNPVPAPAPTGSLDAVNLWGDVAKLKAYDMLMLSCECGEHEETKPAATKDALYQFTTNGGRVFASHFHYTWAERAPLSTAAQWMGAESNPENQPGPYLVDTTFPKGDALAKWLVAVKASTVPGEMPISQPRENVGAVVSPTQRWVYRKTNAAPDAGPPETTKYLSVNTPIGKKVEEQCGKFVFADMHLYGGDVQPAVGALPDDGYPASCGTTMTAEEKALAFLFFDLASCIQDDTKPPPVPR